MNNFLQDLKSYLEANGLSAIYRDFLPDQPDDCIALFLFAVSTDGDGSGQKAVQVQVRRRDPDEAQSICWKVSNMLDSGEDETLINLTVKRHIIARPTARPKKLTQDEHERSIYYCEALLWGEDKE